MKTIYFENPENKARLSSIVTDGTITSLISMGVLKKGQKYLAVPYKEPAEMTQEEFWKAYNPQFLQFDNKNKPTKLVVNLELAAAAYLKELREQREEVLSSLDALQVRYMAQGKSDVVAEIEADKQALRDMTSKLNFNKAGTLVDIYSKVPTALIVDYSLKYSGR